MEVTEKDFCSEFLERFGEKEKQYILDFCNTFLKTFPNVLKKEELLNKISKLTSFKVWDGNTKVEGHYLKNKETGLTTYDDMSIIYREGLEERDERNTCYHELLHLISYKGQTQAPVWGEETYECGLWMMGLQFPDKKDDRQWFEEQSDLDEIMNEFYAVKMLETEGRYRESKFIVKEATKSENEISVIYKGNGYGERVYLAEIYDEIFKDDLLKAKLIDRNDFCEKFNQKFKILHIDVDDICANIPAFSKIGMQISEHLGKAQETALNIWKQNLKEKTKIEGFDLYEYLKASGKVKQALPHVESKNNGMRGNINAETLSWLNKRIDELDEEIVIQHLRPDLVGEQTQSDKILQKKQFLAVINTLRDNIDTLTREDIEAVSYGEMSQYTHSNLSCVVINAGTKDFMTFASEDEFRGSSIFKELPEDRAQEIFGDSRSVQYATVPTPRHTWSIIKDENGYIPVYDNPNMEYAQLTGEVDLTGTAIERTKESSIPRKGQTMNITPDQAEQKQKEEQSKKKANEQRIKMSGLKADISRSKIRDSEVIQSQEEIKEIKNRKSLLFRASLGVLTAEEQEKLEMLNAKYGETENTQTQSKGQRKGNGRGR